MLTRPWILVGNRYRHIVGTIDDGLFNFTFDEDGTRRYLFVTHHLTPSDRRTLQRITRGLPQLRVLREIMDEVYRLFDRRCKTRSAVRKLVKQPPSHRSLTKGMPHRAASVATVSLACRLVPTNSTLPPCATASRTAWRAA